MNSRNWCSQSSGGSIPPHTCFLHSSVHTQPGEGRHGCVHTWPGAEGPLSLRFPHFRPLLPYRQVETSSASPGSGTASSWGETVSPFHRSAWVSESEAMATPLPCRLGRWLSDGLGSQQRSCPMLWPQATSSAPPACPARQAVLQTLQNTVGKITFLVKL